MLALISCAVTYATSTRLRSARVGLEWPLGAEELRALYGPYHASAGIAGGGGAVTWAVAGKQSTQLRLGMAERDKGGKVVDICE
jgi:hypothetical protein